MPFPTWVDFEFAERSAASMARGLSGSMAAWGTLMAHAQAVLSYRSDGYDSNSYLQKTYDFEEWRDIIAAARILDLAATELGVQDAENRETAAILAACAFGMSGTTVSASAVINAHNLLNSGLSSGELLAIAISSPILSRQVFPTLPARSKYRECIERVTAFLARGDDGQLAAATEALEEITKEEMGIWESYLLRLSRISLAHIGQLATAKVLGQYEHSLPNRYMDRLVSESPMLLPSQFEAIKNHGIFSSDRNLLISLPTGTGKTLLGELALMSELGREPGLVCYVAPYVALGRQVAEKINRHTPTEIRVHRLMGGYRDPAPLDPDKHSEVIVATPERFDAMLRLRPDLLPSIRCVVIDEAHMIGNDQRGIRLEGILTRMRLATVRGESVPRFILLSAVLSNADALANWIDIASENIIRGTWRPSAKRFLRWTEDGFLRLHTGDDPMRNLPSEVLGERGLPWPRKDFYVPRNYGSIRIQEPRVIENLAYLARFEYEQYRQPVLCVCSTRPKTRHLVNQVAQHFPVLEPSPPSIKSITDLIDQRYKYLHPLKEALQRGVAYHNSSLPHDIREEIESAVEARSLKIVAATTTLAEGVDLPFRVTILADWLTFDGERNRPMESLLFKNIAGRCGRAGQFTEGDTVVFDNPVGDAQLTSPDRRPYYQQRIFFSGSQPTLKSAISKLNMERAISSVGAQMLAAISENPNVDNLPDSFMELSFAQHTEDRTKVKTIIREAYQKILDDTDGYPLAIAASPAVLTPLGKAASNSGLSPETAKSLWKSLTQLSVTGTSLQKLVKISVTLLEDLSQVPEQGNPDLRKAIANNRSRPVVKRDEIELVLRLWLTGESVEYIFESLPANQRSKRKPELSMWLRGVPEDSTWTDQFAKFYDFIDNCLEFFLPWILRAAHSLSQIDTQLSEYPWEEWARFTEKGVDSIWGVKLLESGVITERKRARQIGQELDASRPFHQMNEEQVKNVLDEVRSNRENLIAEF